MAPFMNPAVIVTFKYFINIIANTPIIINTGKSRICQLEHCLHVLEPSTCSTIASSTTATKKSNSVYAGIALNVKINICIIRVLDNDS